MAPKPQSLRTGDDLCEWELDILEECAGWRPASPWGAAVGAALEALRGRGLIDRGTVTDKGLAALKRHGRRKAGE